MDLTRRRFLRAGAVTAGVAAGAPGMLAQAAAAPPPRTRSWLVPHDSTYAYLADRSLGGNPDVVDRAFNHWTTWFSVRYTGAGPSTPNPVPAGYHGVGVLKFAAYQDGSTGLVDALRAGLPSWVQAVQYDCESWSQTPAVEQGAWLFNSAPQASYAELFCQTAHEHRLRVVLSPGNDLCNNKANSAYPGSAPQYPLNSGEKSWEAYLRYQLATAARWLQPGDVYEYMSQILELDAGTYQSVVSSVAQQVRSVSHGVTLLAGIGRTGSTWDGATADQLTAAANGVGGLVAGFWPNVDADTTRVQAMIGFLENLGY